MVVGGNPIKVHNLHDLFIQNNCIVMYVCMYDVCMYTMYNIY